MKKLITLLLIINSVYAFGNTKLTTRILHINNPESPKSEYEVLVAKDRAVYKINADQVELLEKLYQSHEKNSVVEMQADDELNITGLVITEEGDDLLDFYPSENLHPMSNYTPSNVDSYELAQELFQSLKRRTKWFTQCFNRAHVWAKQMYNSHQVKSMKILIYYTKKYRREINGKWWFHIAPMIDVNGDYYVMDKEFTKKPTLAHDWEKIFTKKMEAKGILGHRCKVIQNISEYYDEYNQKNEYCNIQVTSMYYWEPNDMSKLEKTGEEKTKFINWELKAAAREIFWRWRKVYKQIKD